MDVINFVGLIVVCRCKYIVNLLYNIPQRRVNAYAGVYLFHYRCYNTIVQCLLFYKYLSCTSTMRAGGMIMVAR